jgi:tRNA(fMet)-specific endonuclease VapC
MAVEQYAVLRLALEQQVTPISHPDMQIAAIALANNLVLVPHNTTEFSRISGLLLKIGKSNSVKQNGGR